MIPKEKRLYTAAFGEIVDLNDPDSLSINENSLDMNNVEHLRVLFYHHIGYYYTYIKFHRPAAYSERQNTLVENLMKRFDEEFRCMQNYNDPNWWKELIFLITDYTENLC